ncbi:hypothetical protein ERO13_D05G268133v2 [Gossypium hirsutum]|uniref:Uncharacterized protein n=3 Tax=Gossypium TaxID=3633 RepID=A0A5J5RI69_GOSBA|nr:hypothetical protein ES319_D05G280600v1 [Gossypium barbadense]KAG4148144.1 hypothetical protein ERO13_D05G268133v2 [Gossypium hirsutum]TYG70218.1 hypothetical protein ES288_D05G295500v1 [Gossypium darwinii]TYH72982.1 hypothetical protein ES332_D05G295800v1 [Gossypium tomentosum]
MCLPKVSTHCFSKFDTYKCKFLYQRRINEQASACNKGVMQWVCQMVGTPVSLSKSMTHFDYSAFENNSQAITNKGTQRMNIIKRVVQKTNS